MGQLPDEGAQRRRARRNAILLGGLALAIYVFYIVATGLRS